MSLRKLTSLSRNLNRCFTHLILLLLLTLFLFLIFAISQLNYTVTIYEENFQPVLLPYNELKRLNYTLSSSATRAIRIPQTFKSNVVTRKNVIGGFWPSGFLFMDLHWKQQKKIVVYESKHVQLIMGYLKTHLLLKQKLRILGDDVWEYSKQEDNAFFTGRDGFMDRFKPGVKDIKFIFSDSMGEEVFVFPWFYDWQSFLQPIIDDVLGPGMNEYIGRMQLALIANGAEIKKHVDSGQWVSRFHRTHVPIEVPSHTSFEVFTTSGLINLPLAEGMIFEVNNKVPHMVHNSGDKPRIHLIMDVAEFPFRNRTNLKRGQKCKSGGTVQC